jgi:hypothetical protein
MTDISLFRLYLLRAGYLLLVVGLGLMIWPQILNHPLSMHSATSSLLGALSLMAVLGLRYPLQMLPLLLFELTWKTIWLVAVALPLWRAGALTGDALETTQDCLMGVVFLFVVPWDYVFAHYVAAKGDHWMSGGRTAGNSSRHGAVARGV